LEITKLDDDFMIKHNGQETCSICFEDFKSKDDVRVMKCPGKHIYHMKCIDIWLSTKKTCPNCNTLAIQNDNKKHVEKSHLPGGHAVHRVQAFTGFYNHQRNWKVSHF
jgi:hypothetical protein